MRPFATRRLTLALIGAGLLGLSACNSGGGGAAPGSAQGDMTLGAAAGAPVTVIEYASASCSHCARWNREVWPQFRRRYVDTNRVRYVFREFLTPPTSFAASGFLLARCAAANGGADRYFAVLDAVFRGQEEVFRTQETRPVLLRIAQASGMNETQFNACLRDETALNALNDRVERAARQDHIESTPTFVVNGRQMIGEQSLAQLAAVIDPLLGANRPAALPAEPAGTPASGGSTPAATPASGGATEAAPNPAPAGAASGSASGAASGTAATAPTTAGPVTATTAATSGSPAQ